MAGRRLRRSRPPWEALAHPVTERKRSSLRQRQARAGPRWAPGTTVSAGGYWLRPEGTSPDLPHGWLISDPALPARRASRKLVRITAAAAASIGTRPLLCLSSSAASTLE